MYACQSIPISDELRHLFVRTRWQVLLALKAEAEKASAPPEPEERVIGDAPQRTSDFGPLALAPGRIKVRKLGCIQAICAPRVLLVVARAGARARVEESFCSITLSCGPWQVADVHGG